MTITPERYEALYGAARDWAEQEAEACGRGPLPAWEPPAAGARACGARTGDELELVLRVARDSWKRLQRYWTTEGDCGCEVCAHSSTMCPADLSSRFLAAREG